MVAVRVLSSSRGELGVRKMGEMRNMLTDSACVVRATAVGLRCRSTRTRRRASSSQRLL